MGDELPRQAEGRPTALSPERQSGLVTLLFTDVVGSTALKQRLGDKAGVDLVERHHTLVREVLAQFKGAEEIVVAGDSFLILFPVPSEAVSCALMLQRRLAEFNLGRPVPVQDRMGLHLGEAVIEESAGKRDVHGLQVDTCSRVMSLAQAGQILMTRPVFDNARQSLKGEENEVASALEWLNHGRFELKGVGEPLEICEVRAAGTGHLSAPTTSEKARRVEAAEGEAVLGWRPAVGQAVPNTPWVLEEKLGEGGFGEVWVGRHSKLKERRVFKFCFRADRVRALKREMTLFRLLKEHVGEHPNIVRLHEVYLEDPPFYLEEEYVEGKDLRSWCEVQGGVEKVPLEVRLEIVAQAAEGLQAAHDAGVIHRDVKPGNILVSGQSWGVSDQKEEASSPLVQRPTKLTAKLTDFGIGQVVSEEALSGVTRAGFTQTMLSSSSSHTGTQLYMAPELLAGNRATTRSDIYSLGVVLYQWLVGDFTRPVATDWQETLNDPLLRDDLKHCFAGNPHDRFAGAGQLAKNLRTLPERRAAMEQQQAELAAREKAAYRRGILRTASFALLIIGLLTGLAVVALHQSRKEAEQRRRADGERQRAEIEEAEARRLLYAANLNLAQQAWGQNNIGRLRQLLEETQASPDRGFEWYYWQRQSHRALKTLQGHLDRVWCVAFSPDGQRILSGSVDQTAKVWEVDSGRELLALEGHSAAIWSVAYSPDSQRLVTGSLDQTAKVWEAGSGRELFTLKGHRAPISCVAFSPESRRIITGSWDETAKVWEATSGRELFTLKAHKGAIWSVAFSLDGLWFVTCSSDQTAKIWEASSGRELLTLKGHGNWVWSVAYSPDGRQIATGSCDHRAKVWEAASGHELLTLEGHAGPIRSVAYSPDGRWLVTGGDDVTAKVWEASSGREMHTLKGHTAAIRSVAYSPDGRWIATGSDDQTVKVWEATKPWEPLTLKAHTAAIRSMAYSLDGQRILTGSADHTAKVWEAEFGRELLTLRGHVAAIWSAAFSPDGQRIVTGGEDQIATVWEGASGRELVTLKGHGAGIPSVAFSPDGRRVVTGSSDQTAKVWEVASGRELLTLKGHNDQIWSVVFSPDGRRIVTGGLDRMAKVWEATSGRELVTLKGHGAPIRSVAFSLDGLWLVTCSDDQTARLWEAAGGRELLALRGHSGPVLSAAFSPDGRRIVTGSADRTAKVWDRATARELLTLKGHTAGIWAVAFSPDSRRIVTGSDDQTVRTWSAAGVGQVAIWQAEERAAAQALVASQREWNAEQERRRLARARVEGAIKRWLVLAPIALAPNQTGPAGLDLEQVQGEGRLRPREGGTSSIGRGGLRWREVALEDYVIDFNAIVGLTTEYSVAYAVSYIRSETEQRGLRMLVGSDEQSKVYLNGKEVYKATFMRSCIADQDIVPDIVLNAGLNVLVFKVVNIAEEWKGSIRFTDAQGAPLKGIEVTLSPDAKD